MRADLERSANRLAEDILLEAHNGSIAAIKGMLLTYANAIIKTLQELPGGEDKPPELPLEKGETLADIERRAIVNTLDRCQGNKMATARTLQINVKTLYNKLKAYGLYR